MPLLDLFLTMLWFFLFVVWIWLLISVYGDIFRSPDLGGVAKALWVLFVVLLPYLGVLVYLIARGGDMHQRSAERSLQAQRAAEDYIRQVASAPASTPTSAAAELAQLAELKERGVLTDEEFAGQKAKLLA